MSSPSFNSTGFYSSFTFPSYTPPPGAPAKFDASPSTVSGNETLYSRLAGKSGVPASAGKTENRRTLHPDAALTAQPNAAPRRAAPAVPTVLRTNSPIYAPPMSKVQQFGQRDSRHSRVAIHGEQARTPPRKTVSGTDVIYNRRRDAIPQLVSATTRTSTRSAPPYAQSDLVRTPPPQIPEQLPPSPVDVPSPPQLAPSFSPVAGICADNEGGDKLRNALNTFNDECRELLSMLGPDPGHADRIDALSRAATPNESMMVGSPHHNHVGAAPRSDLTDSEHLSLKWALFLVDSRMQQLEHVRQRLSTSASSLGGTVAVDAATKAAFSAREALLSLEAAVNGGEVDSGPEASQHRKQLCATVSNGLTAMALAESEVFASVADGHAQPFATVESEPQEGTECVNRAVPARRPSRANSPREDYQTTGPSFIATADETLKDELKTSAMLLRELQAENARLKADVQDTLRRREKTRRHLRRAQEEKAGIAKHFDVVAGDNAELHRRIRQLEEEVLQRQREKEAVAQNSSHAPLTDEERAALEASREEYGRLRAQMDRQTNHLQDIRDELLSSERANDTLRETVRQLRDSLVRHRTVIDLLTRDQLPSTPLPGQNSGRGTPRPAQQGPSMQTIEGILAGTISIPSSPFSSSEEREIFPPATVHGHKSGNRKSGFSDAAMQE